MAGYYQTGVATCQNHFEPFPGHNSCSGSKRQPTQIAQHSQTLGLTTNDNGNCLTNQSFNQSTASHPVKVTQGQLSGALGTPVNFKDHVARSWVGMAKVAVAMAVIRATPKGLSPEEYARRLVGGFKDEQLKWKESSSRLKQEVLALRQQLLQSKLKERTELLDNESQLDCAAERRLVEDVGGTETRDDEKDGYTPDTQQDGQQPFTQTEATEKEDLKDDDLDLDSPLFPTPPSSSTQEQGTTPTPTHGALASSRANNLTRHAHFLHTFLRLRTLKATPVGVDMKQWETNIRDTAFEAISLLKEAVQIRTSTYPVQILRHVTRTVVSFAESDVGRTLCTSLSEALGHFVQAVIQTVLSDERLNQTQQHEQLCGLILVVSSSSCLRHGVLTLLTHYVTEYGRHLRRVRDRKCALDAHTYEAMYHVFHTLEKLVEQERTGHPGGALMETVRVLLREELEGSLLHISQDFPLFALYVWHLVGILDGGAP